MVSALSGSSLAQTAPLSGKSSSTVDYEAFLGLLVAQLKNQDPSEPMKSADFMAQLASFSNVEQSVQIKDKLDTMLRANYLDQAGSIVGKTLTSADGSVSGIAQEVQVFDDGLVATLDTGATIVVGPGVRISG
jgi:flagellar basal-body rod modification protein FlgD